MNTTDPRIKPCCVVLEKTPPRAFSAELREAIHKRNALTTRTKKKVLSALDEITAEESHKNQIGKLRQTVKELLISEESYIEQLELIERYFMEPILEKKLLSPEQYQTVFGNIRTIKGVNKELLQELYKEPQNISRAFSKLAPFLKLYSVFAYDYKQVLEILQKAPVQNPELGKFLEAQESRPEVQKKLAYLMVTPIQRMPRYCLLIKQILDCTPLADPENQSLTAALEDVTKVAKHVDSLVETLETNERFLKLQQMLENGNPSIIVPGRTLIKDGKLKEMFVKGPSRTRHVILTSDIIIFCKSSMAKRGSSESLKCLKIWPVHKCKIIQDRDKGAFQIICQNETMILYQSCKSDVDSWIAALNEAILNAIKNKQTLRKESSARRPVNRKEMNVYHDKGISPGQPRRKRRLEMESETDEKDSDETKHKKICLPFKALARRPIRSNKGEISNILVRTRRSETRDVLFPLRKDRTIGTRRSSFHFDEGRSESTANGQLRPYVFKPPKDTKNQNFSFSGIFSGIGNSVKKMFGFGND